MMFSTRIMRTASRMAEAPRIDAALDLLQRVISMLVTLVQNQGERARTGIDGRGDT